MKIIDETGAVVENPDLTLGYLTDDTEEIIHPAVEGVEEQWHWETVAEYPNGGRDVQKNFRWMPRDIRWNKHRNDLPKPETTGNGFWL